jgi:antimicrobial peptide system SdpA family protein
MPLANRTILAQDRRMGALVLVLLAAAATVVLYAVHASLPSSPFRLPYGRALAPNVARLAPESWKFFTRDPQEERMFLFIKAPDGSWQSANRGPNGRASNFFGAARRGRAQGLEAGLALEPLRQSGTWLVCDDDPGACLERVAPLAQPYTSLSPEPSLCGEVGIVFRKPLPWAWAKHPERNHTSLRAARIRIKC